jgi:hypothetical protein
VQRAGLSSGDYTANIVINSNSTSVIVPVMLKMVQPSAPTVQIGQATGITGENAQVSANLVSLGSSAVTEYGHCWSTSPNPTTTNNKTTFGAATATQPFTSNISGLSPSMTYYVKAYAVNNIGITYSDQISFTSSAPATVPTVETVRTENMQYNSIDGVGNITNLGDGLVTDYGFCYSKTNSQPTVNDSKASKGQTSQTGNYTVSITGLQEKMKYYVRAYAVNSRGTAYGTVLEATTADAPPLVTSGMVAYYTFDGENSNEAQGKTEYNGIPQGNTEFSTDIPGSSGKSFQSSDTYYLMNQTPFAAISSNWTINVWIKTMVTSLQTVFQYNISSDDFNYKISMAFSAGYIYTANRSAFGGNYHYPFQIDVTNVLFDGNWHMLTITRASGTNKLYIDGQYYISHTSKLVTSSAGLCLGKGFNGKMDNFRLYNRAISQSEITQILEAKQ